MNKQDIIRMALEAGATSPLTATIMLADDAVIRFAALVAAAAVEQERKEFAVHAIDIARKAIEEEREACAKICDDMGPCGFTGESCAAAIRERSANAGARGELK